MENRWIAYLIPPFIVTLLLVAGSQFVFIQNSFYQDLGLGRTGTDLTLVNYLKFLLIVLSENFLDHDKS